jgi:hypothetical protein
MSNPDRLKPREALNPVGYATFPPHDLRDSDEG